RTPSIPDNCQWCFFLRNHDELTLEMVTEEERQWMWREYAPEPRMRLNQGIRRRLAPLLDNDRRRIELANSLIFTLPGSPIIYYGDEIGMGDNIWLPDRNGVRTPMQWENTTNAGFTMADPEKLYAPVIDDPVYHPKNVNAADQMQAPDSLLNRLRRMIAIRKNQPALSEGGFEWIDCHNDAVAAYLRMHQQQTALLLHNLSASPQTIKVSLPMAIKPLVLDLLDETCVTLKQADRLELQLSAYEYRWLQLSQDFRSG
ncbi:MAG: alpha-glucosidase C-terminal domain-containing protein, partial [Anaerolineaceae bacterium]|nr:alpha-glucosidase C-terminal domain-containing protein [Anaerolineaceae bacterium]